MLYLIGLGLNKKSISLEGIDAIGKCKKIYLENYTVNFPYLISDLEKTIGKKIEELDRAGVESDKLVKEAKKEAIALLVYGSPLFATTHETLLLDCRKAKVKTEVIFNASVFDAIALTGLQLYKFGKITSMPKWQKNFTPDSFMDIVKENLGIKAHSLILCDIGLGIVDALHELGVSAKNKKIKLDKIIVCSQLGTKESKIYYDTIDAILIKEKNEDEEEIELPFCIIIPIELHFMEKEGLESLNF